MKEIVTEGSTVDEAVQIALEKLKVSHDQVDIDVLESGSRGFLGLIGGKQARVRVTVKESPKEIIAEFLNDVLKALEFDADFHIYYQMCIRDRDSEEMIQNAIRVGLEKKQFKMADKLVVVAGVPIISPIMVNTIRVLVVGNIIARGANAGGTNKLEENADFPHRVTGRVVHAETPEAALAMLRKKGGEILVTKNLDMSFRCV